MLAFFREKGITLLEADWTNADAEISLALAELGKNSVPTNVFLCARKSPRCLSFFAHHRYS